MSNDRTVHVSLSGVDNDIALYTSTDGTYHVQTLNSAYNIWIINNIGLVSDVCVCKRLGYTGGHNGYTYVFNNVFDAVIFKLNFSDNVINLY